MKKKVNLLIIGAQKAGTTSLYEYIKQHPDVYFSEIKEITYFVVDKYYQKGIEYFHSFFSKYNNEKIIASSYVHMLPSLDAPERVLEYNKNMKFIIMLRDPVSRAYSAYNYAKQNGWENDNISFIDALESESMRKNNNQIDLLYFYNGLYSSHIDNWMSRFSSTQFLIITDTELRNDSKNVLSRITSFLNIQEYNFLTDATFNVTSKPRVSLLNRIILTRNEKVRNIIGFLIPSGVKKWVLKYFIPKLLDLNKSNIKFSKIKADERKIAEEYFKNDLINLKQKYHINFVE